MIDGETRGILKISKGQDLIIGVPSLVIDGESPNPNLRRRQDLGLCLGQGREITNTNL